MSSISRFINNLICWIFSSYTLYIKLNVKLFRNQSGFLFHFETWNHSIIHSFIRYHLFSFVVPLIVIRCHSLPFFVTRCHSLSFVVLFIVTLCHLLYHSFSFVVTFCTTHCHSLSFDLPLVYLFINRRKFSFLYVNSFFI